MNQIITKEHQLVANFYLELENMSRQLESIMKNQKPLLNGECFITDTELSSRLKLTKRTLQEYRNNGKIPYYQIGRRILYRESDIEKLLSDNRREAFR